MPQIPIPPDADIQLRNALLNVEQRLKALEKAAAEPRKATQKEVEGALKETKALTKFKDIEVSGDAYFENDINVQGKVDAGHLLDGLIDIAPEGNPHKAQDVVNVHGSIAVAPGGLSADSVRARNVNVMKTLKVQDVDPLAYAAKVYLSSDETISTGSTTAIPWDLEEYDNGDFWTSGSPTIFTIPVDGLYITGASVRWRAFAANVPRIIAWILTGSEIIGIDETFEGSASAALTGQSLSGMRNFDKGDTLKVNVFQNRGGDEDLIGVSSSRETNFWIKRLGPKLS